MVQYKVFRPSYSSRSIQQAPLGRVVCDMDFVPCPVSMVTYGIRLIFRAYDMLVLEEGFGATGKRELSIRSRGAANSKKKVSDLHVYP